MLGLKWNCNILGTIYVYLQIPQKETKENTNFDELPKINSRIKITTKKNIRFGTKVRNFTFKFFNQEVLQCLQKFIESQNKAFYHYITAYIQ